MVSRSIFHFSLLHTWISSHPYVLRNLRYESRLSFKISHLICQGWNMIVNRNHLINQMLFIVQEKKIWTHFFDLLFYYFTLASPLFLKRKCRQGKIAKLFYRTFEKSSKMSHLNFLSENDSFQVPFSTLRAKRVLL